MNEMDKIYRASLIAGLKLFGYRKPQHEGKDPITNAAKKWKIDLEKYKTEFGTGLIWGFDDQIIEQTLEERKKELEENTGELWGGESGDFEYIFNFDGNGITDINFLKDQEELERFITNGFLFTYCAESDTIYKIKL